MKQILLFNVCGEKLDKMLVISAMLGIPAKTVEKRDHSRTVKELLGDAPYSVAYTGGDGFEEEMLIMNELDEAAFNTLLEAMRRNSVKIALKAIVTEHNSSWPADELKSELAAEHEAMMARLRAMKE